MANIAAPVLRRSKLRKVAATIFILLFCLVVAVIWWNVSLTPLNPLDKSTKTFTVSRGDGVREVAKKLRDQSIIRDQVAFFLLVKKLGIEKNIQAGTFALSPSMSAGEIAAGLQVGKEDTKITIPEGWRTEQILEYLEKNSFAATQSAAVFARSEGYYFPDTYLVPKQITANQIFALMRDNFGQKVSFPVTREQLIIASLVEREAKNTPDRPLVASVIYNRLQSGMALDIDATVQYAIGYTHSDGWWKKELTPSDIKFKSPYNTYQNPGLPPGPICNPGLSAIQAAINPATTDYYFYLSDKSGQMHYARTLSEHNQNIQKYL
ncbi:MAG: hypothetical protein UY21_C0002G0050 [Microgenomates group bacterium GW2011_GWA1_48_10]|nr:MAG: hypothetical protein UY21_C0002G0050 [Microgenomates group bacterium GW2011_GWA1_48_10]